MRRLCALMVVGAGLGCPWVVAQEKLQGNPAAVELASAASLPDSPSPVEQASPSGSSSSVPASGVDLPDNPGTVTKVEEDARPGHPATLRSLIPDILHDQKAIWLSPLQLGKGRGWIPLLVVAGGTAGLIVADPHVMPYFRDHAKNLDDVNDTFDETITTGEIAAVPATLLLLGSMRHDSYMTSTAFLAGEAYANSAIVDIAIKAVSRRQRPSDVPAGQNFNHTFFSANESVFKGSSFPSGHAAGAFSVATVVASRYKNHKWVPWAAYGMATAISFSRVTTSAHFPSDVFLGAALGYSVSRFEVLRQH